MKNLYIRLTCTALAVALVGPLACDDSPGEGSDGGTQDGAAGSDGSGGTGGTDGSSAANCGITEPGEPGNNTRDNPTPYAAGSDVVGCVSDDDDIDFFSLTAPAGDLGGGYFEASLTNVGQMWADLKIYTASDNSEIVHGYATSDGGSLYFYWAAAPGQTYRIAVASFSAFKAPSRYTLKVTYTKVDDTFEPNDTRDTAKPITLGATAQPFIFAGYKAKQVDAAAYQDWFSVTLAAGMVTVKVEDVPTDIRPDVHLYKPDGTEVNDARAYNTTAGGSVMGKSTLTDAGSYKVMVEVFSVLPETGKTTMPGVVPDSFKRPYKLTVTQP